MNLWLQFKFWLAHKFNPHCQHCEDLLIERNICNTCEVLKLENARLLDLINKLTDPKPNESEPVVDYSDMKPLRPAHIPWSVKRAELEHNDRETIKARREAANTKSDITSIQSLEDEVLGSKNGLT